MLHSNEKIIKQEVGLLNLAAEGVMLTEAQLQALNDGKSIWKEKSVG